MTSADGARALALALPEAVEQDHHGFPSFRVGGKIFSTLPDPEHLNVMLDADEVAEALEEHPGSCAELHWGKSLAGVRVTLAAIDDEALRTLLVEAWRRRAPKGLAGELD